MLANRALRGNLREEGFVTRREAAEKAGRAKEDMRLFEEVGSAQCTSIGGNCRFATAEKTHWSASREMYSPLEHLER